jgi:hypothetical protein
MPASLVFAEITGQVDYSREVYENAIASGKPVLLDFSSKSWGSCRAQGRTVSALLAENPKYQEIIVISIEWAQFYDDPIVEEFGVAHRATLVMLKGGGEEVDRVKWLNSKSAIGPLLEAAFS